jgi:hypothetical protein
MASLIRELNRLKGISRSGLAFAEMTPRPPAS